MKQRSRCAFVLADSIVALTIISLSITFTLICHNCLLQQAKRQEINLAANRLAKEASDELVAVHHSVNIRRGNFLASANRNRVVVYRSDQKILEVVK